MITSVELGDFVSHSSTKLEFGDGVTVFVGDNGTGKSSVIDAITFALFGKHTRKTNKSLIKLGSSQAFAKVNFSIGEKQYEAVRRTDSRGTLYATFARVDGKRSEIVAGERRQFGESMTREVEQVIGLDFEKLKIASIVRQGELDNIINSRPKEFKELLNAIIGIDKLDLASESMRTVNREFRERIKSDLGHDDTDIEGLLKESEEYQKEIAELEPEKRRLELEQEKMRAEVSNLRKKVEDEALKPDKKDQLKQKKRELREYAEKTIQDIKNEINRDERRVQDCKGCFGYAASRADLELEMQRVGEELHSASQDIVKMKNQEASLKEKLELASKIQLKDGKCPVCNSEVEKLNSLFNSDKLLEQMSDTQKDISSKEEEAARHNQNKRELSERLQNAKVAEETLKIHRVSSEEELEGIQKSLEIKKQNIPQTTASLYELAKTDAHAKMIFEDISRLEEETKEFDEQEYVSLKRQVDEKQNYLSQTEQSIGAIGERISNGNTEINSITDKVSELKIVKKYVTKLNEIHTSVFNRDGYVATSLRSWVLETIAAKASEYLIVLDTKIQRIALSEKKQKITITCHAKNETLELESLSGGEKVGVALALRLGMASLLGASNLNLMILDEPTANLDADRRRALVRVLSQLSNISSLETKMQFLIITHDAEIFEDTTVEQMYKFESDKQESKVTIL